MRLRDHAWLAVFFSLSLVLGCSSTTTGTGTQPGGSSGSSGSSSGASGQPSPAGRCTGNDVEAYQMTDVSSCQAQGGSWRRPTTQQGTCDPPLNADFCGSKTAYEAGSRGDYGKADCVQILGCIWENPDGTTEQNPLLGARCSGTPVPCKELPKNKCFEDTGCEWLADASKCWDVDIYKNTQPPCLGSVGTDPRSFTTHPNQSKFLCLRQPGCSFTLADGTVENAPLE